MSPQDLSPCAEHLFVAAMVVGVHPRACRESANQNLTEGQFAFGAVKGSKSKARCHCLWLTRRLLAIRLPSRPAPAQDLWLTRRSSANRLLSPASPWRTCCSAQTFVRRCHGGLGSSRACRESANQRRGSPRSERQARFAPCPEICYFAPKISS